MTQPVLAVDLDGVTADFYGPLSRHVADWRGVDLASLPTAFGPDLAELGLQPGEYERLHRHLVVNKDLFATLDPVPGAPQALRRLSAAGVRIHVVTHRFYVQGTHALAAAQTVGWLERHAIPYWDISFVADKTRVLADVYVDDSPINIRALEAAGRTVVAFTSPPNVGMDPAPRLRADDWPQAEQLVLQHLPLVPAQARR